MTADPSSISGSEGATMVVGSHSTVSGLIYKGGIVTFAMLVVALLSIVAVFVAAPHHRHLAHDALAIVLGLALMCTGEGLESLVVPNLFAFLWLGITAHLCWTRTRTAQ
jgi:hypothetical protein